MGAYTVMPETPIIIGALVPGLDFESRIIVKKNAPYHAGTISNQLPGESYSYLTFRQYRLLSAGRTQIPAYQETVTGFFKVQASGKYHFKKQYDA